MAEPPAPRASIGSGFWAVVLAPFVKTVEVFQLLRRTEEISADLKKASADIKMLSERVAHLEGQFKVFLEMVDKTDANIATKFELEVIKHMQGREGR